MLGIDTILGTVCIAKKSIYSEVLTYSGKRPLFYAGSIILAFLIFISYMVYFPPKTNLFIVVQ